MVKAITTIYLQSEILEGAKVAKLHISQICEEALKLTLSGAGEKDSVKGALSNFLSYQAEKSKDISDLKKASIKRDEKFHVLLRAFCSKYNLDLREALKEAGL